MAGVSLDGGGGESQIAQESQYVMKLIEAFVEKNDMARLSAVIGWSKQSNELLINQEAYDSERNEWLMIGEGGVIARPSNWDCLSRLLVRLQYPQTTIQA